MYLPNVYTIKIKVVEMFLKNGFTSNVCHLVVETKTVNKVIQKHFIAEEAMLKK